MPRPKRCRRICGYPEFWSFAPEEREDGEQSAEAILLTLDEYEAIRLIDLERMSQEQCAQEMDVARTTVTAIYEGARRKLADALVNGRRLLISGGRYRFAEGTAPTGLAEKGSAMMRLAVTYQDGDVFQHFGHAEQFKVYDIEDGKIVREEILSANGSGHGALAVLLKEAEVDTLLCGGIGGGARSALAEAGIALYPGVSGSADAAVKAYLDDTLQYDPDTVCAHHAHDAHHHCGQHEHGEGHRCGHHDHGEEHKCGGHGCH